MLWMERPTPEGVNEINEWETDGVMNLEIDLLEGGVRGSRSTGEPVDEGINEEETHRLKGGGHFLSLTGADAVDEARRHDHLEGLGSSAEEHQQSSDDGHTVVEQKAAFPEGEQQQLGWRLRVSARPPPSPTSQTWWRAETPPVIPAVPRCRRWTR